MILDKNKVTMLRAEKCMSLRALAEKSKVCTATIRRSFKQSIAPETAGKIAAALGVPVQDIIIEED